MLVRRIRELLYSQGFTINGARNRLDDLAADAQPLRLTPEILHEELLNIAKMLQN